MRRCFIPVLTLAAVALTGATAALSQTAGMPSRLPDRSLVTGSISAPGQNYFQLNSGPSASSIATQVLQRFPANGRQLRFENEVGWLDLPFYVRPAQIEDSARLRLRYVNSVAVMPEASRLIVYVNDQPIAETNIEASSEPATVDVPIPAGVFEAGYNSVRISVQQRHRVDCTIQATNELWTQIDPVASGIAFTTTNDQLTRTEDLLGLPVDEDGATPIFVNIASGADAAIMDRSLRAAQALAVRLDLRRPRIAFSRELTKAPGIQIIVGTIAELRSRGIEINPLGDSGVQVAGRMAETVRVTISGASAADVDESIDRLAAEKPADGERGTRAGLRALAAARGFPLNSEGAVSLRDIGFASQDFGGRVFRSQFNIVLPSDFYPADNGKATLMLNAGYAAGLLTTNEVRVHVNGKIVGARRLKKSYGESMRQRALEMSLKTLQPGFNSIMIEIHSEAESDRDCNPLSLLESSKRLVVSDQTAFTIPRIARVAHLPSMSATAATGFPLADTKEPLLLYMPKADFASLGAAGTLLARAAVAAGKPIATQISLTAPEKSGGNALIVGTAADTPAEIARWFGLPKEGLPASWIKRAAPRAGEARREGAAQPGVAPSERNAPAKGPRAALDSDEDLTTATAASDAKGGKAPSAPDLLDQMEDSISQDSILAGFLRGLANALQRNIGYSADQLSFLNGGREPFAVSQNARLLVAQAPAPGANGGTWLLLMAQDSATLARDTAMLVAPTVWNQLGGRVSTLDTKDAEVSVWQTNSNYYYRLDDKSLPNITLFAAGWLSNNILYYVLVILTICGMFGIVSRLVLNRIGTRP
ncbi:MAG TPA: cellulose biosynthesis cyclic di-GMP-binding regulatory protein BcsB [Beijerinckiaceae bacterium]|nr:cellulose biosynthesis cyclic di-GMP-binding regulatory protein BcsB [Beijerinckiaceae bacterium]